MVRIIPLGGVGEIGKNCTVYESGNDIIVVDCGLAFPDESMLGVDIVIPDFTYLVKNRDKVRGVFVTHGHEDHIGSLVFLLKQINVPIYSTKLTLSLIEGKLKEHGLLGQVKLHEVKARQVVKSGCFSVEFIEVNH
ncbi:MAG: ribonuclease J, partial [Oscillospiraceae bacterium]